MTDRKIRFTPESVERGDKMVMAQVVHCSFPGCTHRQEVFNPKGSRIIPPSMFARKLRDHHWTIRHGTDPYCPEHSEKPRVEKLKTKPTPPKLEIVRPTRSAPPAETFEPGYSHDFHAYRVAHIDPPIPKETPMSTAPIRSLDDLGAATARQMTVEHRRKINREIADNWSDDDLHYLGDMSDQKIAAKLSVPRAWVEQVRVENFGDSGGNEEIDDLKAMFDAKLVEWDQAVGDAQRTVDKAVEAVGAMERLRSDLKAMRQRLERVEVAVLPRRA